MSERKLRSTTFEKHTSCFLCGSNNVQGLDGYHETAGLVTCNSCGFVFMERIPTATELNDHYSQYSYGSEGFLSPLTIKSYNDLLDELEPYRKTGKLMDVGCGRGYFLIEAAKRGWEVVGTEYSAKAVELCEAAGIAMVQGALSSSDHELESFDVITSFEVIEHINNPNEELQEIHKLLRKGGLFYCTTPNFNSLNRYYQKAEYNVIGYPEHLSYYTVKTLHKVLKANGFSKDKILTTGVSITRIKTSKKPGSEKLISEQSSDEKLRRRMNSNGFMQFAKTAINKALSLSRTGMTLKGYFVKP